MREGEWHGPGIHFNSITYMERHTLHWALRKDCREKATEHCTSSGLPTPLHCISPWGSPQSPQSVNLVQSCLARLKSLIHHDPNSSVGGTFDLPGAGG